MRALWMGVAMRVPDTCFFTALAAAAVIAVGAPVFDPAVRLLGATTHVSGSSGAPWSDPDANDLEPRLSAVGSSVVSTSDLVLIGTAQAQGSGIRLTGSEQYTAVGAAWTRKPVRVAAGFQVDFGLRITPEHPVGQDDEGHGDGVAFVLHNDPRGTKAHGADGLCLGYGEPPGESCGSGTGISDSLAVEFDTNRSTKGVLPVGPDPDGNHISIHSRGHKPNSPSERYSIGATSNIPNLTGRRLHVRIKYLPGTLIVWVNDLVTPRLNVPLELTKLLSLPGGRAYVGFTGSTGYMAENHDISALKFTNNAPTGSWSVYRVRHGDTLWHIAAVELGDPYLWQEIAEFSRGIDQADGLRLSDPDVIRAGWILHLPNDRLAK